MFFVQVLFSCFDLLFFLVLEFIISLRIYLCHIRNVIHLALLDVSFLQVVVFVVLEVTLVLWYLSVTTVRRLIYSLTIANL